MRLPEKEIDGFFHTFEKAAFITHFPKARSCAIMEKTQNSGGGLPWRTTAEDTPI